MTNSKIKIFPEGSDLTNKQKVKFGIDPTFPKLHLGHLVPLRLVKQLQDEGKDITIVLGTFTAQMGDPSGKDKTRPILNKEDVESNADHILNQVNKILSPGFTVFRNGDLFNSMTVPELMQIVSKFTTKQLLNRDAFQNRMATDTPIGMHELIVPVLQGWDSVHLNSCIEVGGTDQLFNFQVARKLQELEGQTPEICVMAPIINGTDGSKMSKSSNNCIFLDESLDDIFGKCMSVSDETMAEWVPLLTDLDLDMSEPMDMKKDMAMDIVRQIRGLDDAGLALSNFEARIQKGQLPDDMVEMEAEWIVSCVAKLRKCSNSESRRLIKGGAVTVGGNKVDDTFELKSGHVLKAGKRFFATIL